MKILKENQDKINWENLSKNPNSIELLKKNQNKINWIVLSSNPNAIELLKENPNIFTYDYKKMKEKMKNSGIVEELMAFIFNPKNINKWHDWGFSEHHEFVNEIHKWGFYKN